MKKILRSLRIAFVYIGTMVGAGFATGEEIRLYFGNSSIWALILSSICAGLFCMLLLLSGKVSVFGAKSSKFFNVVFAICGIITSGIMLAGIKSMGNSPLFVVISLLICLVIALYGNFGIKVFNFIAVPLIIISVLVVAIFNRNSFGNEFNFFGAVGYSAMNIFFESVLMYKEGEKVDKKEIILTSVFVSMMIFVLVFSMQKACLGVDGTMPFLLSSKNYNLGWLAFGVIILAIYSTVVNCLSVSVDFFNKRMPRNLSISLVFFATLLVSVFPFEILIGKIYPIFSYSGIILSIYILIIIVYKKLLSKNIIRAKRIKLRRIKE